MTKTSTFTDRIIKLERLQSSRYGNPRWLVSFAEHGAYKTNVDGQVGYGIENRELHDGPVLATVERIRGTEQVTHLKPAPETGL